MMPELMRLRLKVAPSSPVEKLGRDILLSESGAVGERAPLLSASQRAGCLGFSTAAP